MIMSTIKFIALVFMTSAASGASHNKLSQDNPFSLSVVHFNDFHARFEETSLQSTTCESGDACIGGLSRLSAAINHLRKERPDSIVLNAGDNFQGTIWYNHFKWNATQYFLNKIPTDAIVLGNHEFDDKIAGVVPFMKHLKAPVIVSNLDDSLEPTMKGLYRKSVVVQRNGKKIGIIGVLTSATKNISSSEKLIFLDESESINKEAERLVREEGVFTNIVLSHCGYDVEQQLAKKATGKIALIVGGHSHTFLYTGKPTPGPDTPRGPYPTEIKRSDGNTVLVIQASAYAKYVGNLTVVYDDDGNYVKWFGKPIFLDEDSPKDEYMTKELQPWKKEVDAVGGRVLGETLVTLEKFNCRYAECLLGDFLTDAMVDYFKGKSSQVDIAITNPGGIRTPLEKGNITYADLLVAQPFENSIDTGVLQGKYVREMLEFSATPYFFGKVYSSISTLQISGIHVEFDLNMPVGKKATSIKILCLECETPVFKDLDDDSMYKIAMPSFLSAGGDNFGMINLHLKNKTIGPIDIEIYTAYIQKMTPINYKLDGRMKIIGDQKVRVHNLENDK